MVLFCVIDTGLNNRYYDACSDFFHTVQRARSFAFIGVFGKEFPTFVYAKACSPIECVEPAKQKIGNVLLQNNYIVREFIDVLSYVILCL